MTERNEPPQFLFGSAFPAPATDKITYPIMWLDGVKRLAPIKHYVTWTSFDTFDLSSGIITMTGLQARDLPYVLAINGPVEFTNERPPKPPRGWWRKLMWAD